MKTSTLFNLQKDDVFYFKDDAERKVWTVMLIVKEAKVNVFGVPSPSGTYYLADNDGYLAGETENRAVVVLPCYNVSKIIGMGASFG